MNIDIALSTGTSIPRFFHPLKDWQGLNLRATQSHMRAGFLLSTISSMKYRSPDQQFSTYPLHNTVLVENLPHREQRQYAENRHLIQAVFCYELGGIFRRFTCGLAVSQIRTISPPLARSLLLSVFLSCGRFLYSAKMPRLRYLAVKAVATYVSRLGVARKRCPSPRVPLSYGSTAAKATAGRVADWMEWADGACSNEVVTGLKLLEDLGFIDHSCIRYPVWTYVLAPRVDNKAHIFSPRKLHPSRSSVRAHLKLSSFLPMVDSNWSRYPRVLES
ncbi:uncharacterized protein BDR25DRAFT_362699 [Lindgomyces ingoldianus]|uniref:Uncharacterized protein n=1 Tax=Lindgomyces ingoldianus TaxID=673940 RepID=A0ACB6Q9E8_9PLEO|nr:uncharacterized protein BDR25DRAFT_362699 [Lindgomyces ingoldianus]KAF2463531.1 hypothetical protein BDR25DRAFT_362699 [Lindgomyces ingoldianus]